MFLKSFPEPCGFTGCAELRFRF